MIDGLIYLVAVFWLVKGADLVIGLVFFTKKLPLAGPGARGPAPRVSVIFAARDEAGAVAEAVDTMLAQDHPDLEVIAVDDRSTDGTSERLNARTGSPRLKVVRVETLPAGWLGKNHALYEGYRASTGDWLLFTDADVQFSPSAISRAVSYCESNGLDHLTLFPKLILGHYIETAFTGYFALAFNMRFRVWAASRRASRAYVGIGAFNLVRRKAYEAIGTHRSLAMEVADDMMLGKNLKRAGFRQSGVLGDDALRVRWVSGFRGVMGALHKNAFRGLNYDARMLVLATIALPVVDVLPFLGIVFAHGAAQTASLISVLMILACYAAGGRDSLRAFPSHPLLSTLFLVILWRSAVSVWREGGVRWRGTLYPIKDLARTPL